MKARPPRSLPGTPRLLSLPAGTPLYRVHSAARSPAAFNTRRTPCLYGGGRFDATTHSDGYGYLYAGLTEEAAVCESLLRSVPFAPEGGPRLVQRAAVRGRRFSFLRTATELRLVPLLSGRDLAAVGQDAWLVQADPVDYPYTRDWGHWIRAQADPAAQGFIWPSKREPADHALVLFADRCPDPVLEDAGPEPVDLDTPDGTRRLNGLLAPYGAAVPPSD
ncbi:MULTISPECIES: RES family NAD+ phosphorylase [Streptomyces]|uniref:RES domain-containing protein n=1 Tax=Streptomyces cacaoi TaxID=1898 RepID=A0A4Y3R6B6_STRCI|nr:MULTISPECIES: RES family NAD+ phosphorylase [Streptomyces]NNG88413.1 RES family NAD+ phosphorylase [Streptomyces cacaoi]QHF93829.1 hypothetical protein DEH18_08055 [Streptomyces sp. NHF165]GEB53112.1 hypothetical protein SCA03_56630 [Streptomyces cacaoi]